MRRPFFHTSVHKILHQVAYLLVAVYFRFRIHGIGNYPQEDGFLICCNHQSHLDPFLVGVTCPRAVNTIGRDTLTKFKPFGAMLNFFNLIAIDREGGGLAGLKETIRRLREKETVVIFPEGTRTRDGELQPFKMGFATIARKVKVPILPMTFDGPFHALPRSCWFIRPVRIHVVIGKPILEAEYRALNDEQLTQLLSQRMAECFAEARKRREA
jgi:1-acyl-sn-glycerol-3-phosphate acyltransferase